MRRLRTLAMAVATATLAITALGTPVSAAGKGDIAIVNGIPGTKVDVCVNGREIRSKLPYGKAVFRKLISGSQTLKVFRKDPRTCRGTLLAMRRFWLGAGGDKTIVATKHRPKKVLVFDNTGYGRIKTTANGYDTAWAWRHAADVGTVSFNWDLDGPTPTPIAPITPSADPAWVKGAQLTDKTNFGPTFLVFTTLVRVPDSTTVVAGPVATGVTQGYRYEWILVGSRYGNARIVTLKRPISIPF